MNTRVSTLSRLPTTDYTLPERYRMGVQAVHVLSHEIMNQHSITNYSIIKSKHEYVKITLK